MPSLSNRQLALRDLSQTAQDLFLLEVLEIDDVTEQLERLVLLRALLESQRYPERPLNYNMKAEMRAARIETVLGYDDRHFGQEARMSRTCFWQLVDLIKHNPVFPNQSHYHQDPSHHQLLVTLFRLGKYGNGAGTGHTASYLSLGDGTTEVYTWRCFKAIYDLRSDFIRWPNEAERIDIAADIAHDYVFGNCVGMMDGSLIPLEQRPGLEGANDYWNRKQCYALNIMAICDNGKRTRALITGWPGAVHDQRVFDMSPVSPIGPSDTVHFS